MAPSVLRINLFYAVPVAIATCTTLAWQAYAAHTASAPTPIEPPMATTTEIATTTLEIATTTATSTPTATSSVPLPAPVVSKPAPAPAKAKTSTPVATMVKRSVRNLSHLTTPTGLIVRHITDSEIMISWKPSTGDQGVAGYTIYQDGEEVGTTLKNTFAAIHLAASTTYTFAVEANDNGGNTSAQATISVKTTDYVPPPLEPTPPPPPAPVYGVCGAADGATYSDAPTAGLCSTGIPSIVAPVGNSWNWSCVGAHGGTTAACRAIVGAATADTTSSGAGTTGTTGATGSTGGTNSTGGSGSGSTGTTRTPKSVTITVNQSGVFGATSASLFVGDTIIFQYNGTGDEVVVSFSPTPPSSMKLDHEFTSKSYKFTTAGTWSYSAQGHSGTITVTP